VERGHLGQLPDPLPDTDLHLEARAVKGWVRVTADYSVPPAHAERRVGVRVTHERAPQRRRRRGPRPRARGATRLAREARRRLAAGDVELPAVDLARYDALWDVRPGARARRRSWPSCRARSKRPASGRCRAGSRSGRGTRAGTTRPAPEPLELLVEAVGPLGGTEAVDRLVGRGERDPVAAPSDLHDHGDREDASKTARWATSTGIGARTAGNQPDASVHVEPLGESRGQGTRRQG
jgi:hypothetical protein